MASVYIGSQTAQQKLSLDITKVAGKGVLAVADSVGGTTEKNRKLLADFKALDKATADLSKAWPYDALMLLADVMKTSGSDRAKIRDGLLSTKGYEGMMGTYTFSPNADVLTK
jgi:ABC-type branched-subunit amino acid transport system substrate-binding protein